LTIDHCEKKSRRVGKKEGERGECGEEEEDDDVSMTIVEWSASFP
jgi:hypothetical protein